MTIKIIDDSEHPIDLEEFVIKVFAGIKCADGTENTFQLNLRKDEVRYLAYLIRGIGKLDIVSDRNFYTFCKIHSSSPYGSSCKANDEELPLISYHRKLFSFANIS